MSMMDLITGYHNKCQAYCLHAVEIYKSINWKANMPPKMSVQKKSKRKRKRKQIPLTKSEEDRIKKTLAKDIDNTAFIILIS